MTSDVSLATSLSVNYKFIQSLEGKWTEENNNRQNKTSCLILPVLLRNRYEIVMKSLLFYVTKGAGPGLHGLFALRKVHMLYRAGISIFKQEKSSTTDHCIRLIIFIG